MIASVRSQRGRQHMVIRRRLDRIKLSQPPFSSCVDPAPKVGAGLRLPDVCQPNQRLATTRPKPAREWKLDTDGDGLGLDDFVNRSGSFQMLRKSTGAGADQVLTGLGATGEIDREIVLQLGARRPLGHPRRFEDALGLAARSLEVLDRNGHRSIPVLNLGFLSPVVGFLVQIVTQFIVRSYISSVIDSMYRLSERREAASPADWEHLPMLTRARLSHPANPTRLEGQRAGAARFLVRWRDPVAAHWRRPERHQQLEQRDGPPGPTRLCSC